MRGLHRSAGLVAGFACALALVACGGGGGDGADVDALTGCLKDAGLDFEAGDVDAGDARRGLTDQISVKRPGEKPIAGIDVGVQIGVFGSADDAEKYSSDFSGGHLKQVDSILIFALDTDSKEYDETVSCAEEATG